MTSKHCTTTSFRLVPKMPSCVRWCFATLARLSLTSSMFFLTSPVLSEYSLSNRPSQNAQNGNVPFQRFSQLANGLRCSKRDLYYTRHESRVYSQSQHHLMRSVSHVFPPWMFFSTSAFSFWVRCVVFWRINSLVAATARSTLFREASSRWQSYDTFFGLAALLTHMLQDSCILHRIRRPPRIYPPDLMELTCFLHSVKSLSPFY